MQKNNKVFAHYAEIAQDYALKVDKRVDGMLEGLLLKIKLARAMRDSEFGALESSFI